MHLAALYRYPLKSCAAEALNLASVGPLGLAHDRTWMLVDANGRFITGREQPALVRVRVALSEHGARFEFPSGAAVQVAHAAMREPLHTQVWKDAAVGLAGSTEADAAFSDYLDLSCRLLWLGTSAGARVRSKEPRTGLEVSFADGFPLLLLGQASVEAVNLTLARPVGARHFRPNLLVAGSAAFEEDAWQGFRVGEVEFDVVNRCTRCIFTTVDPETGKKSEDREPLITLSKHRRFDEGVCLGVNVVVRRPGVLRVGDAFELIKN